jgi:uncharacterized membrane-anchored protein YitT (DUF2179 family)
MEVPQIRKFKLTKKQVRSICIRLLTIIAGSIIMAISYNALVIPFGLLSGGIGGLALFGKYLLHIPFYVGYLILNIPIFILGFKEMNWKFMIYSFIGTATLIITLPLIKPLIPVPHLDIFLAAIFSGVAGGFGDGIILRSGSSTGGTDIISLIAKKKWNISIGVFSLYCNVVVIAISLFFFDLKIALYTIVSMYISAKVVDRVVSGFNNDKSVTIISEKSDEIARRIIAELNRGVTLLQGQGAFSGDNKNVINCVVNHFEIAKLKEILTEMDPQAFMFITEAIEVSGRGFTIPMGKPPFNKSTPGA